MKLIDFKNLPDTTTPINDNNLNQMQQNAKDVFDGKEAMKSIVVEDVKSKNLVKSFSSANATAQYAVSLYADFEIEPNTTYTISFVSNLAGDNYYTNEALFDSVRCVGNANGTITVTCTSLDAEKIASAGKNPNGYAILKNRYALSASPTFSDVQIEPGNAFTGFVEHKNFGKEVYSLNETKIGTWIDGKPLYRKVIDCGNLPNATTKSINTGMIANQQNIVKITGFATGVFSDIERTIPIPYNGTNPIVARATYGGRYIELTTDADLSTYSAYVILEYTKVSD